MSSNILLTRSGLLVVSARLACGVRDRRQQQLARQAEERHRVGVQDGGH